MKIFASGIARLVIGTVLGAVGMYLALITFCIISEIGQPEMKRRITCNCNLKQIGLGLEMYANDYNGFYPDKPGAMGLEQLRSLDYITDYNVFICPNSKMVPAKNNHPVTGQNVSYCFRGGIKRQDRKRVPICWEKKLYHNKGGNILYTDGYVEFLPREEWKNEIKRAVGAGHSP